MKEIVGNIIPAIASTTVAIVGIKSLQIYTLLLTDNLNLFRNSTFNLGTSIFDLYIPEEKRLITEFPKNENSSEIKVIPREYIVWD